MEPAHVGAVHPLSSRRGATVYAQRLPHPHQPLRRWPMREPAEVTRDLAPVRQSALRLLALAETYAQGPCVKTTHR